MSETIPIRSDPVAKHWVWLQWHAADPFSSGGVSLSGQMLAHGEYEYSFLVRTEDLPALWAALGLAVDADQATIAAAVRARYDEKHDAGISQWLAAHDVPCSFWSRVEED